MSLQTRDKPLQEQFLSDKERRDETGTLFPETLGGKEVQNGSPGKQPLLETQLENGRIPNKIFRMTTECINPEAENSMDLLRGSQHTIGLPFKRRNHIFLRPAPFPKGLNFLTPLGFIDGPFSEKRDGEGGGGGVKAHLFELEDGVGEVAGAENGGPHAEELGDGGARGAVVEEHFGVEGDAAVGEEAGVADEAGDDLGVGEEEGAEEFVGGDDVLVEAAGEEAGAGGDDVDELLGGGALGAEEAELGGEDLVGVAEEDAVLALDDTADLGLGEALPLQEGYHGVRLRRGLQPELAGGGGRRGGGEPALGYEVRHCEGVRLGAAAAAAEFECLFG